MRDAPIKQIINAGKMVHVIARTRPDKISDINIMTWMIIDAEDKFAIMMIFFYKCPL